MESSVSSTKVSNDSLITIYFDGNGQPMDTMIFFAKKAKGVLNFKEERKKVK